MEWCSALLALSAVVVPLLLAWAVLRRMDRKD